ncbi:MAG TPA: succinylglutamate desuccinylase/aspartoacylase family protein [Acetobacteraceae bacterium]|nr:succinylglutamate desuccinylase/aspartoacylase family protein [Acetobacteraceae bacterium]
MQRRIVRPGELDLESPGRRDYFVALEHDSIWGDHLIPLTVFVGPEARPGQGLVAFGSTHGNEYEGPVALKRLCRELDPADARGRVILVPVLNPAAFKAGARDSVNDDRVNLNRAFVDGAGHVPGIAGITYRIADFVRRCIWPQVHVVIDLHSGGMVGRFLPCMSYHPIDDPAQGALIEETARLFGTPLIMTYQNETPGLLTSEAERLGKITVGSELGHGCAVSAEGVGYALHGVRAAGIRHGLWRGELTRIAHHAAGTQRVASMVDRSCFTMAPFAGHYEPLLECGAEVGEGDVVGLLHDFDRFDLEPFGVRAGRGGIVICQAWEASVRQGQHILVVGVPQS